MYNTELPTKNVSRPAGRWKEPAEKFQPDLNITQAKKKLIENSGGMQPFLPRLTKQQEMRICIRYLSDKSYRLTRIAGDIKTRPATVRTMFEHYGIDFRRRCFVGESEN